MKKVIPILVGLFIAFIVLYSTSREEEIDKSGKLRIVTTTTMVTDLVSEIGQDKISVKGLMGAGVDPHLYKASEGDVAKLSNAEAVIYNGLHLEGKLEDVFEKMEHRSVKIYRISDAIEKSELIESSAFASNYDPHIWFSTTNWKKGAKYVGEVLAKLDSENAEFYKKNADEYIKKIEDFERYSFDKISRLPKEQRILVTAHDAFNYFGKVYGFQVLGLQGLSTASEAGVQDVKNLADFIYEHKVKAVFVESSVPKRNIEALQKAVKSRGFDVTIGGELFSDALGNPESSEGTYLGMFKHNLDTIVDSLIGK